MSYLVLARKHRPQGFDELIGQEHITEILKQAITNNRIAHAYLFCGPRGVGKTSMARIFAKCLNDEKGPTVTPDENSSICKEIAKGTSFDVLEIDGASNRGIDEIRTLRENVKFAPSYARFKIYIVDEVHMLTTEAFNALLKTLEEPPEHVKFIFATTDPNKLPQTILSRCQRFDFKRISFQTTIEALKKVSGKENFQIEDEALYAIAKAAQGSLRDALSILDQISAISDKKIQTQDVCSMLGIVEIQAVFDLVDAIAKKDCSDALLKLDDIIEKGKDMKQLLKDLTEHFRHLMIIKVGGKTLGKLVDYPSAVKDMFLTQAEYFSLPQILSAIDILIKTQETVRVTESVRMPVEIAFARLTYDESKAGMAVKSSAKVSMSEKKEVKREEVKAFNNPMNVLKSQKGEIPIGSPAESQPEEGIHLTLEKIASAWDALTHFISKRKMSLATYLQEGQPVEFSSNKLFIGFPSSKTFQKEACETEENIRILEETIENKWSAKVHVKFTVVEDYQQKDEEPSIKSALDEVQGKVVNKWYND